MLIMSKLTLINGNILEISEIAENINSNYSKLMNRHIIAVDINLNVSIMTRILMVKYLTPEPQTLGHYNNLHQFVTHMHHHCTIMNTQVVPAPSLHCNKHPGSACTITAL